jgi:ribosome assembly protein YihI (activator of Der GTPase)
MGVRECGVGVEKLDETLDESIKEANDEKIGSLKLMNDFEYVSSHRDMEKLDMIIDAFDIRRKMKSVAQLFVESLELLEFVELLAELGLLVDSFGI